MDAPEEYGQFDPDDEDVTELDMTEDEFDAGMVGGEPVMVIGVAAWPIPRERVEDYYTLQISDSRAVPVSAGRWGSGPQLLPDQLAPVASAA